MNNLQRLFTDDELGYLAAISIPKENANALRQARDDIRATIGTALASPLAHVDAIELSEEFHGGLMGAPKFRMQGSFTYHTANYPAHVPPQRIDLDDGLFLPLSFDTNLNPQIYSAGLFRLVETAVGPLASERGWEIDASKPSCVRIILDPVSHIDIAIYAVYKTEYLQLAEKYHADEGTNESELDDSLYRSLSKETLMLAHREEGWKPSDPRALENWFVDAVNEFGPVLRRICRYLKGWRDHQWKECKLSSIALMAAIVQILRTEAPGPEAMARDDLLLHFIASKLPRELNGTLVNPVVEGQNFDDDWPNQQREDFVFRAKELAANIVSALNSQHIGTAIQLLRACFGERIPDSSDLVEVLAVPATAITDRAKEAGPKRAVVKRGGGRYA